MGTKLSPNQMQLYKRIDEILFTDWDPISVSGIQEVRDEYYEYLPVVFHLAIEDPNINSISEYLYKVETERMGLSGDQERCNRIENMVLNAKRDLGL